MRVVIERRRHHHRIRVSLKLWQSMECSLVNDRQFGRGILLCTLLGTSALTQYKCLLSGTNNHPSDIFLSTLPPLHHHFVLLICCCCAMSLYLSIALLPHFFSMKSQIFCLYNHWPNKTEIPKTENLSSSRQPHISLAPFMSSLPFPQNNNTGL